MVLNADQLDQLSAFIQKKGFRDPLLQAEILDHFASKTEEILSTAPELPFEEALLRAYRSFGIRGFRPLVENFEKSVLLDYRRWRKKMYSQILTSIHLPGILLVATFSLSMLLFHQQQYNLGAIVTFLSNPFHTIPVMALIIDLIYNIRIYKSYRTSYTLQVVRSNQFWGFNVYLMTYIVAEQLVKLPGWIGGSIIFVMAAYITLTSILRFRYIEHLGEKENILRTGN